ncbi:MAG: sulfate adenylyltransferase [Cellvibrionales bacterium TMED148]|nr:sulfate adenylyltransferase [Porticoccaceae bacterium]RPG91171.1 MAG: sulfate adenylyltransferase [Cellvibrionales bacterium TMED148]
MIDPYGSSVLQPRFVSHRQVRLELIKEASKLPKLMMNASAAANVVMLGAGYFNPLEGFMGLAEALRCAEKMQAQDDLFWPIPIINVCKDVTAIQKSRRIALLDPNNALNQVLAIMDVDDIEPVSREQLSLMANEIFSTADLEHPGVSTFTNLGSYLISGKVEVLNFSYYPTDFPATFQTANQIRDRIAELGWQKVVAFQTRNPMHRAHEELCRMAMERLDADGVIVHMLLGKLKQGDIPADVRDSCIRLIAEKYFPRNKMLVSGYGFDMLYAGPREAILHAIVRQNMGATHLIVGRDHAGVGNYYTAFQAQEIFTNKYVKEALDINIFCADHTAYSKKLGSVVMMNEVKDHDKSDFLLISGTEVREMLINGRKPPPEFCRSEVVSMLMEHYQS